jgi:hypothetical protein
VSTVQIDRLSGPMPVHLAVPAVEPNYLAYPSSNSREPISSSSPFEYF